MQSGYLVPEGYVITLWPSALKRLKRSMCQPCIVGKHQDCEAPACPCLCNDHDWQVLPEKLAA
jgi:hypothetical protein